MAKPKSTKVDKATALKLAQLADAVMSGDYSNGFLYRAQEDRADFFAKVHRKADDSTNGNAFIERMQFGKLWEDKDYAFRIPIFYRNRTGLLDALMLQHTLSEDGSIKRSVMPIPLDYCDTHSVEQQVEELLPHFGKACKQALERALSS